MIFNYLFNYLKPDAFQSDEVKKKNGFDLYNPPHTVNASKPRWVAAAAPSGHGRPHSLVYSLVTVFGHGVPGTHRLFALDWYRGGLNTVVCTCA